MSGSAFAFTGCFYGERQARDKQIEGKIMTAMNLLAESAFTDTIVPDAVAVWGGILSYLIYMVAWMFLFIRVGELWWKALIPIYGQYLVFKIVGKPFYFWLEIILALLYAVIYITPVAVPILMLYTLILVVVLIVVHVNYCRALAKSFGHGAAFTLGLIFLPYIFLFVLAFDGSVYIGEYVPNAAVGRAMRKGFYGGSDNPYCDTETSDTAKIADDTGVSDNVQADPDTMQAASDNMQADGGTDAACSAEKPGNTEEISGEE